MNSVKNAIVTMTLLAVGYGAYVVLSNPLPEDVGELAEGTVWETPDITPPTTDMGADANIVASDAPPPLSFPTDPVGSMTNEPPREDRPTVPTNSVGPRLSETTAPPSETPQLASAATSNPSAPDLSRDIASGSNERPITPGQPASSPDLDPHANFYVSRSGDVATNADSYPQTATPELSLPNAPPGDSSSAAASAPRAQDTASGFEATWQSVQTDLKNGQLGTALAAVSTWFEEPSLTREQEDRLLPLLDQLAGTVIYSRDSFLEPAHVVQNGETLSDLAKLYEVPLEFLARVNGIDAPYEVLPGESIKVVRGPFRAEVSRSRRQITLFLGRYYAGRFPTRLGAELPSEENTYDVVAVEPGLEFFDSRTGRRVSRDDPENPYGAVWISLRGNQITAAHNVGIHVDKGDAKRCCISVSPTDAADLAAILGSGSSVHVHE